MMKIIDTECLPHAPSSKFISKEEYHRLFPDKMPIKKNFIFKYNTPLIVENKVGRFLQMEYGTIKILNKPQKVVDNLDLAPRSELISTAIKECGAEKKLCFKMKKKELIDLIRRHRNHVVN